MPAILTSNMSTLAATSFVDMLSAGESNIYLAIGGGAEHPWENENVPPTPTDTLQDEKAFREGIIGIKHVSIQNAMLMIPRVNWQVGMAFNPLSETTIGPRKALDYYCLTSDNFVYQCVKKDSDEIYTQAGGEPDLMIADQHTIDGYTWKFLYNVTTQMVNEGMLLDAWMPVPYNKHGVYPGGTITEEQNSYGDRNQELPVVSNIEVVDYKTATYKLGEEEVPSYVVTLKWSYEKDLGYDQEGIVTLVDNGDKIEVVEFGQKGQQ